MSKKLARSGEGSVVSKAFIFFPIHVLYASILRFMLASMYENTGAFLCMFYKLKTPFFLPFNLVFTAGLSLRRKIWHFHSCLNDFSLIFSFFFPFLFFFL